LAEAFFPRDPEFRFLVSVRDRQYPDGCPNLDIGYVVSEHLEVYSPITPDSQARYVRMLGNPPDVTINLISESVAQSGMLSFIIDGVVIEFISSLRQNDYAHAFRLRSTRAKTSS